MDIKTAFLNGQIEEVYILQSEGFEIKRQKTHGLHFTTKPTFPGGQTRRETPKKPPAFYNGLQTVAPSGPRNTFPGVYHESPRKTYFPAVL